MLIDVTAAAGFMLISLYVLEENFKIIFYYIIHNKPNLSLSDK